MSTAFDAEERKDTRCVAMVTGTLHYCSGRHCVSCGSHMPDDGERSCSECRSWSPYMKALKGQDGQG